MVKMFVFCFPWSQKKDLDSRHILGYFFHYTGINNADRQAFSGFWFAFSKGRRKCAASFLDRVGVAFSWYERGCFCVSLSLFDMLFCMCNVYISTSEEPTWFENLPEAGNQTKSFPFCQVMDTFTWGKMKYFKGKGHPLSASQNDRNRSSSRVIVDNCCLKKTLPLAPHS